MLVDAFRLDGSVVFLHFGRSCGLCFSFLTVSPLLSSFSSLLCLLSRPRAVVIPLFVPQCFDSILSLFCFFDYVFYYAQFIAQGERVLGHFPLTPLPPSPPMSCFFPTPPHPLPVPDCRAAAYCTYVFSSEV